MTSDKLIIGADLGGTKTAVGLVTDSGRVVSQTRAPTNTDSPRTVVEGTIKLIDELLKKTTVDLLQCEGIGLGVPGMIDFKEGVVVFSPHLPFKNTPVRELIETHYRVPVFLDNDANVAALGELYYGAGKDVSNLIMLTIGTGIGGGIIIGGKLYRGATGSAGELGHMVLELDGPPCHCGNLGCFEELAAGDAIAAWAKKVLKKKTSSKMLDMAGGDIDLVTGELVARAARDGDRLARDILESVGLVVGAGLANIVNIFNPEMIILGGGVMEGDDIIIKAARGVVAKRALIPNRDVVKIVVAKLGSRAGVLGAAALVLQELGWEIL